MGRAFRRAFGVGSKALGIGSFFTLGVVFVFGKSAFAWILKAGFLERGFFAILFELLLLICTFAAFFSWENRDSNLFAVDAAVLHGGQNLFGLFLWNLDGGVVLKDFDFSDISSGESGAFCNCADDKVWNHPRVVASVDDKLDVIFWTATFLLTV